MIPRIRLTPLIIAIAAAVVLALLALHLWRLHRTERARSDLSRSQGQAVIQSGRDSVNTVSARSEAEAGIHDHVDRARDAVGAAPDANSADRAGRAGLCGLASYRDDPRCRR